MVGYRRHRSPELCPWRTRCLSEFSPYAVLRKLRGSYGINRLFRGGPYMIQGDRALNSNLHSRGAPLIVIFIFAAIIFIVVLGCVELDTNGSTITVMSVALYHNP